MRTYANKDRGGNINANVRISIFLTEHLVHKILTIVTRLFVSFIKIPVLLTKSPVSFVSKITNQLRLLRTINSK